MAIEFFTETFRTDGYDSGLKSSFQGQLASSYTNALTSVLTSNADWIGFVAHDSVANGGNGLSVADALAVKALVAAGSFTLNGLFGAAQGAAEVNPTDPLPTLTVNLNGVDIVIDLREVLSDLDTETWTQSDTTGGGKKAVTTTTVHTREFYTDADEPDGYDPDWWQDSDGGQGPGTHVVSDSQTFTKLNGSEAGDTFAATFDLLGATQANVVVHASGLGDYNWDEEGFEISGDVLATLLGSAANNGGGPGGEALTFTLAEQTFAVSAGDYNGDGSVDLAVHFTDETGIGSKATLWVEYDYWA